ncbi:MAG TPA: hypothetical protein VI583_01185 [Cyclobacteriaceae bacterium]|nr:hypothetical protein [Cyclobacteriaceae bacterium]
MKIILPVCLVILVIREAQSQSIARTAKIEKSIAVGVNVSNYVFESSTYIYGYLTDADKPNSTTFNMGFYVKLYNPQLSNRFSLSSGLIFFKINQNYVFIDSYSVYNRNIYDVTLNNSYLKIPFLINYDLTSTSVRPYLLIGTHSNIILRKFNYVTITRETQTGSTVSKQPAISPHSFIEDATKNLELMGLSIGGGIKFSSKKRLAYNIESKFENISSLSNILNLGQRSKSLFLTFGVIF